VKITLVGRLMRAGRKGCAMRWVIYALAVLALAPPALAGDYDILRGSEPVGPATFTRWSGFYVGGDFSYSYSQADFSKTTRPLLAFSLRDTTLDEVAQPSSIPVLGKGSANAFGGGGFLGYNTQWQDLIIGVEGNYTHTNLSVTASSSIGRIFPGLNTTVALNAAGRLDLTDYGEARFRAGYVVGNLLPYGFVGMAVGRASYSVSTVADVTEDTTKEHLYLCAGSGVAITGATCQDFLLSNGAGKSNALLYGFTVGGGLDWALTPNIFARGEFEFVQFAPFANITAYIVDARVGGGVKF
jgi:outer membrane immunogenic protein